MPTPAATLQAQIDAIDAMISNTATAGYTNLQDGGTSASFNSIDKLISARNQLQALLDRVTGVKRLHLRGRVVGLPGGAVSMDSRLN
jgi:hypothetical protein